MTPEDRNVRDRQWYIAERWQEYEGERRANLLRIIAIGLFYIVHLLNYHGLRIGVLQLAEGGDVSREFHVQVTLLAVTWTMLAVGTLLCLRQRIFPRWLKLFSTGADIVLLTAVLYVSNGPQSPLVLGYPLIIVLATLRLSLPLVRFATAGSMLWSVPASTGAAAARRPSCAARSGERSAGASPPARNNHSAAANAATSRINGTLRRMGLTEGPTAASPSLPDRL